VAPAGQDKRLANCVKIDFAAPAASFESLHIFCHISDPLF
jgi:hypothetical protein